ncbi:hypothetical protein [Nocardiopsis sp. CNR-923]|uniref:hypothetical protein n=1 Tax=Nocardiopsis sp. CNR-923 TaxID=1904965 RepID=UPI00130199FF|nr:hypothetical protein [Nocardiopsis sp. CNR-923]
MTHSRPRRTRARENLLRGQDGAGEGSVVLETEGEVFECGLVDPAAMCPTGSPTSSSAG